MRTFIYSLIAAGTVAAAAVSPATAAEPTHTATTTETAPSKAECDGISVLGYAVMGKAMVDSNQQPRFTVSEFRGKLMEKSEGLLGTLAENNRFAGILGGAKISKDTADTALKCGIVKKDPERPLNTSSSEMGNLIGSLLGIKLPF